MNVGQIFNVIPYDYTTKLYLFISDSYFFKNNAPDAIMYVTQSSEVSIQNSEFTDNFSTGRGSILFAEKNTSNTYILGSSF